MYLFVFLLPFFFFHIKQFQLARLCNLYPNYPPSHLNTHSPFTVYTYPISALRPIATPPASSCVHAHPAHPFPHTSSYICLLQAPSFFPDTPTSSQSPYLPTFTPASTHSCLQYHLHIHRLPLLSMPSHLPMSCNIRMWRCSVLHIPTCYRHTRAPCTPCAHP